jgi:hypothetical protein
VIVDDLHVLWAGGARGPDEAYPPLAVDADAPLAFALAPEPLQAIAGTRQIAKASRRVELVELALGRAREPGKRRDPLASVKRLGALSLAFASNGCGRGYNT